MTRPSLGPWRPGVAGAFLIAVALTAVVPAGQAAHGGLATPQRAEPAAPPLQVGGSQPVTLVTGEKVVLTTASNGEQSLTAAANAGGEMPTLHAIKQNGDVYVWPADL